MQKILAQLVAVWAMVGLLLVPTHQVFAGGDHGHGHGHEEEQEHAPEGPHGGRLLESGDYSVEITMAEAGIPPEMRVYAYKHGELLLPNEVNLEVLLTRLGGVTETVQFNAEQDYLVSRQSVAEPHSFAVEVHASIAGQDFDWHYDNFNGRTEINDRLLALAGIETQLAATQQLHFVDRLFGVVAPITDKQFNLHAPYDGVIKQLHVSVGDKVKQDQLIATITNAKTLQTYQLFSPANGQITQQYLTVGNHTVNGALVQISDLSQVWLELSAFPNNIAKLTLGQKVTLADDDHHTQAGQTEVSYIAPMMTGGHIARVRAVLDNPQGQWRPGMHIQADIETATKQAAVAVKVDAIQTFMDKPAVFVKHGNIFEARPVILGESDGKYVEVINGLASGTEYVIKNSYLLKADIMKNAAKHVH